MTKQLSDKVPDKEFFDMVLDERLKLLPHNRHDDEMGDRIIREGDEVIAGLTGQDGEKVKAYMDMLTEDMMEYERTAYLGGLKDGIRLLKSIIDV